MLTFVALVVGVITLLTLLMIWQFKFWERKGVATGKVTLFFGDNYEICLGKESPGDMLVNLYNKVPAHHRYLGGYLFHVPVLVLRTPDIIKKICVKDFDCFVDHGNIIINSADEMWQRALFPLKGQAWKDVRQLISPVLNGNKVKTMFPLIERHSKNYIGFVKEKNQDIVEVDFKDVILRILNDISSDTAIGIEVDSHRDPKNYIFEQGEQTCNLSKPYKKIVLLLYTLCPLIPTLFGMSLFAEGQEFYENIVRDTLKLRKEKGIKRDDMIGMLLEAREEQLKAKAAAGENGKNVKVLTDEEIAAYVFVMYFGTIDSVTTQLAFLGWELAIAPEIQERLRNEVDSVPQGGGDPTYQDICDMKYMDMVICEVLRKWPGVLATDRVAVKPYTIEPVLPHEKPVRLEVGQHILLPIYAIHRNPDFFEDPDKFDPERFSPENKHKIDPNAYVPFGSGPRSCVATRFSNVLMKLIYYHLLRSFEIVPVEKTKRTLVMETEGLSLYPVGGFPLGLKRRK